MKGENRTQSLDVSELDTFEDTVEVVDRKGLGHPDTICDALAETLSRNLYRKYRRRFGRIVHQTSTKHCYAMAVRSWPFWGLKIQRLESKRVDEFANMSDEGLRQYVYGDKELDS